MPLPEYIKTKEYFSYLIDEYTSVCVHNDTKHPKIVHTHNDYGSIKVRECRDYDSGNFWPSSQDEFELMFLCAQKAQENANNIGAFDLGTFGVVNITAFDLARTTAALDQYDYVGTCDAFVDSMPNDNYGCWLRFNRHGHLVYGQLTQDGVPNAWEIIGFLDIGNDHEAFMNKAQGESPGFFTGVPQELIVKTTRAPLPPPRALETGEYDSQQYSNDYNNII